MPIEFDVKPTQRDYFIFNMRHTYTSIHGIVSIIAGIAVVVLAVSMRDRIGAQNLGLYILLAIAFLIYYPLHYWLGSKRLAAASDMAGGMHFSVEDDGVHVSMQSSDGAGTQSEVMTWDMFYLALAAGDYLYLYSSRINAYIVPKSAVGDRYEELVSLLREKLPEHRRRLL